MENKPFMYLIGYDQHFMKACNTGWGCGYVAIPLDHKLAILHFARIEAEQDTGNDNEYHYVNKYFELDGLNQEITYTQTQIINDIQYLVIGFDLAHSWNDSSHDFNYCFNETVEMLNLINKS